MTLGAKALRRISRISKRSVSNHGFETDPIIPQFWRGKDNILDQQKYLIGKFQYYKSLEIKSKIIFIDM